MKQCLDRAQRRLLFMVHQSTYMALLWKMEKLVNLPTGLKNSCVRHPPVWEDDFPSGLVLTLSSRTSREFLFSRIGQKNATNAPMKYWPVFFTYLFFELFPFGGIQCVQLTKNLCICSYLWGFQCVHVFDFWWRTANGFLPFPDMVVYPPFLSISI